MNVGQLLPIKKLALLLVNLLWGERRGSNPLPSEPQPDALTK